MNQQIRRTSQKRTLLTALRPSSASLLETQRKPSQNSFSIPTSQKREARSSSERCDEPTRGFAKSYGVSVSTISRSNQRAVDPGPSISMAVGSRRVRGDFSDLIAKIAWTAHEIIIPMLLEDANHINTPTVATTRLTPLGSSPTFKRILHTSAPG